ncbi:hypothetical protein BLNAU_11129 [Blattamonas nauphoetae]|uniref:Uncharacterized protein n=1 Tax=Blattamonas nauphoetae TaxID=2049346 RepID=A0ABQ9XQ59_9EUKA|nr:hypothetical protein BLNAU_11129 [Blattamonas nauphoetae]
MRSYTTATQVSRAQPDRSDVQSDRFGLAVFKGKHYGFGESVLWLDHQITIYTNCEYPELARVLCKLGFFVPIVGSLASNDCSSTSMSFLTSISRMFFEADKKGTPKRWSENGARTYLDEEGWQDAMEFVMIRKTDSGDDSAISNKSKLMMHFCGSNLGKMKESECITFGVQNRSGSKGRRGVCVSLSAEQNTVSPLSSVWQSETMDNFRSGPALEFFGEANLRS